MLIRFMCLIATWIFTALLITSNGQWEPFLAASFVIIALNGDRLKR